MPRATLFSTPKVHRHIAHYFVAKGLIKASGPRVGRPGILEIHLLTAAACGPGHLAAFMAIRSAGPSFFFPLSTSMNSSRSSPWVAPEMILDCLALSMDSVPLLALFVGGHQKVRDKMFHGFSYVMTIDVR